MARTLNSITIVTPSSDPNISEGGNFTFEVSLGYSGGGGWNTYDIKFEYDDSGGGTNWQTITDTTDLSIDTGTYTNPLLNQSDGANVTMVIDGDAAGSYDIRAVGDPSQNVNHNRRIYRTILTRRTADGRVQITHRYWCQACDDIKGSLPE